jgi:hypothetical protein
MGRERSLGQPGGQGRGRRRAARAQAGAQDLHDRTERGPGRHGHAVQDAQPGAGQRGPDEAGLADARLAGHEDQGAVAVLRPGGELLDAPALAVPSDELLVDPASMRGSHAISVRARTIPATAATVAVP